MWNNKRFTTEQLGERRDFPSNNSVREHIYKTIAPSNYPLDQPIGRISDVIFNKKRMSNLDEINVIHNNINNIINSDEYKFFDEKVNSFAGRLQEADNKTSHDIVSNEYEKLQTKIYNYTKRLSEISEGYGTHDEDAWRFYLGLPQINNTVQKSKYKPTNAKNKNAIYYTLKEGPERSSLYPDNLHGYKEDILLHALEQQKFPVQMNINTALANMTVDKGMDDRGEYISFYDIYDFDIPFEDKIGRKYEIYDRIYYKDYGDGEKKRMYYSDKELSELDVNKKNFDTFALQRELRNRGYKLLKSIKDNLTFDGILGDETKNALLDWQSKNKTKVQGNTYVASKLLPKATQKLLPKATQKLLPKTTQQMMMLPSAQKLLPLGTKIVFLKP